MALPNITLPANFLKTPSAAKGRATLDNYVSSLDLHKDDVRDMLIERYGSQRISQDLQFIHGDMRPTAQTKFIHFEEEMIMEEAEVSQYADASVPGTTGDFGAVGLTAAADYLVDGKTSVRSGDIVLFATGQTAYVTVTTDRVREGGTAAQQAALHDEASFVVRPYQKWTAATTALIVAGTNVSIIGRENVEFGKMGDEILSPRVHKYENSVMIIDEVYAASGTEMTNQIWIPVKGVNGKSGYLWYYKGELDTRNRFENYCDMLGLVGELAGDGSAGGLNEDGYRGTRGYLNDLELYGGRFEDDFSTNKPTVTDIRTMVKHLNKYKGAKENLWYAGIDFANLIEEAIGADIAYYSGGQNFGSFNNSEDNFVNLGFSSVKVSNYRFAFKTLDSLNDPKGLGAPGMPYSYFSMVVPTDSQPDAKDSSKMIPSLSVRYKAMDGYSREMEHFLLGGANGVYNQDLDGVKFQYRTERGFEGMALNRHFLWKHTA